MTSTASNSTRNFISMQNKYDRIVLLVDMDCFYCQVEEKLDPKLKGKPLAVVQYNAWRGGGIIAVNYAARAQGVTRHMRGDEAKEQCPDIYLAKVPNVREKADLTKYREAGKDVANVLQRFTSLLERASVDEAYLDITASVNKRLICMNEGTFVLQPQELGNTYAVGYEGIGDYVNTITTRVADPYIDDDEFQQAHDASDVPAVRQSDIRLLIGASIANEIRAAVKSDTGFECSAGIAHNKILAKLACGMNKPNKQTILPLAQIPNLFETLPVSKIKGLGAKFGEELCERLNVRFMGQLLKFTEAELQRKIDEKNGSWLYYMCRGIDLEAVTPRFYSKSIGCCKKFPGRNNITGINTLKHWLNELANEIVDRLEKDIVDNNRRAKQMVVSYVQDIDGEEVSSSRSASLMSYEQEMLCKQSLELIKSNTKQFFRLGSSAVINNPIKFLGISVGKFQTITSGQNKLQEMFANQASKQNKTDENEPKVEPNVRKNDLNTEPSPTGEKMKNFFQPKNIVTKSNQCLDKEQNVPQIVAPKVQTNVKENDKNTVLSPVGGKIKSFFQSKNIVTKSNQSLDKDQNVPQKVEPNVQTNVKENDKNNEPSSLGEKMKSFFQNKNIATKSNQGLDKDQNTPQIEPRMPRNVKKNDLKTEPSPTGVKIKSFFSSCLQNKNAVTVSDQSFDKDQNVPQADESTTSSAAAKAGPQKKCHSKTFNAQKNKAKVESAEVDEKLKPTSFFITALQKQKADIAKNLESENEAAVILKRHSLEEVVSKEEESSETNEESCITIEENQISQTSKDQSYMNSFFTKTLNSNQQINPENLISENSSINSEKAVTNASANKRKFTEISNTTQTNDDADSLAYQVNYAEFAVPPLNPELMQLIKCEICGAKIPDNESSQQMHQDHHFAQQLSQQQRTEYRAELKMKPNSSKSPPSNKKVKTSTSTTKTPKPAKAADITKFLRPAETIQPPCLMEPSTSLQAKVVRDSISEYANCERCNALVLIAEMEEHKDFHMAKELQKKLNQLEVRTVAVIKKPKANLSKTRNNLNSSNNHPPERNSASKPITQFFTQKSD